METQASRINLGAILLQVRDGMNYRHDKISGNADDAMLRPIAFASKSISSAE